MIRSKRVLRLANMPFSLNTAGSVESAVNEWLEKSVPNQPRVKAVHLQHRKTGRYNGCATVELTDERQLESTMRVITSGSMVLEGRTVSGKIVLRAAEDEAFADEFEQLDLEHRPLPTVDEIRDLLLSDDSHEILKRAMLPGLTMPEWEAEKENGDEDDEDDEEEVEGGEGAAAFYSPIGRFAETIVRVDRVNKVVKGGVITRYRALVVVGNLMGAGGYAFGKAATPAEAVARASRRAKKDLHFYDRFLDVGLTHDVRGKHNDCTVDIFAVQPGYGTYGGKLGKAILTQLGFSSFSIRSSGRRNPASYVYATFDALNQMYSVEEIAKRHGRRLLEVEHALKWEKKILDRPDPIDGINLKYNDIEMLKAHVDASTTLHNQEQDAPENQDDIY